MLSSRGICRTCRTSIPRPLQQHHGYSSQASRQLSQSSSSSALHPRKPHTSIFRVTRPSPLAPHQNAHIVSQTSHITSKTQLRFASTTQTPVTPSNPPSSSVDSLKDVTSNLSENAPAALSSDHWHIGYLKFQGIDFGWGPSSCISWLFEHIHVSASIPMGLSIGASIAFVAVLMRTITFPLIITSAEQGARMRAMQTVMQPIQQKMKEARATQNTLQLSQLRAELGEVFRKSNIQPWKLFLPMLQIPLGFCSWRVVRNMADLPVEGMTAGGWLWFQDLSVPDPFTGLPLMMAGTQFLAIKLGGETGTSTTQSKQLRRAMQYGLPVLSYLIVMWAPAGVTLSFFSASVLATLTSLLMRNPSFRRLVNLSPLVNHTDPAPPSYKGAITIDANAVSSSTASAAKPAPPSKSPIGKIKTLASNAASNLMPDAKKQQESSIKKRIRDHARDFERKREKEIQTERRQYEDLQQRERRGRNY